MLSSDSQNSFLTSDNADEFTILLSEYNKENQSQSGSFQDWKEQLEDKDIFVHNFLAIDVEEIYQVTGKFGKYQKWLLVFLIFNATFISIFDACVAYWYYLPQYYCKNSSGKYVKCNQAKACRNQSQMKFDYEGRTSIVSQFNLECSHKIQFYISILFIFTGIGDFIVEFLCDILGRKQLLIFNNLLVFIGGFISLYSESAGFITIGNSILVVASNFNFTMVLVIISESVPNRQRKIISIFMPTLFSLGFIGLNFLNIWILDYQYSYKIAVIGSWLFIIPSFLILETLYFSQSNFNIKEMYLNTIKLGKINGFKNINRIKQIFLINLNEKEVIEKFKRFKLKHKEEVNKENNQNQYRIIDRYFIKSLFCLLSLVVYAEGVEKYILIIIEDFGLGSIQQNGMIMGISELAAFALSITSIIDLPRKLFFNLSILLTLMFSLVIFLIDYWNLQQYNMMKVALCFGISMIVVVCNSVVWTYAIEIFESKNRMIGISMLTLLVFCAVPIIYQAKSFFEMYGLHPVLVAIPCAIVAKIALCFLHETIDETINQNFKSNFYCKKYTKKFQFNFL